MSAKQVFIDTNILVYAYDRDAGQKNERAKQLLTNLWSQAIVPAISVQVLQEFYVSLTKRGVSSRDAKSSVETYLSWEVIQNTSSILLAAFHEQQRFQLSFWDSSVLAAARQADAKELWSEDFSTGQNYDGVLAVNPLI